MITPTSNMFNFIYQGQADFMKLLATENKCEHFPVSLNTHEGQQILRLYCNYLSEELQEYYEAHCELLNFCDSIPSSKWLDSKDSVNLIIKVNEEVIDCLCFIVNLGIFMGLKVDDYIVHYANFVEEYDIKAIYTPEVLQCSLRVASWYQNQVSRWGSTSLRGSTIIPDELVNRGIYPNYGARFYAPVIKDRIETIIFSVNNELSRMTSLMKLKPWRDQGPRVDMGELKNRYFSAWGCVSWLMHNMNLQPNWIVKFYNDKRNENVKRFNQGY